MRLHYFMNAFIFLLLASCGTVNDTDIKDIEEVKMPNEEIPAQIIFLYFDIKKGSENKELITLTNTQIVAGQMKENVILNAPRKEGNLILQILDNQDKVIEEQIIQNPLNKNIETYDQNNQANTKNVQLEESQFYMRYNNQNNPKNIKILKILPSGDIELYKEKIR